MSKGKLLGGWLLRDAPDKSRGVPIATTRQNTSLNVEVLERSGGWYKIAAWVYGDGVVLQDAPPITPTPRKFRVGLNCLYDAATAEAEARAGCRYFLIMNSFAAGEGIANGYAGTRVILRKHLTQNFVISDQQAIDALEGMRHKNVTYMLYNENDQGDCKGAALISRATQDVRLAEYLKQINPTARYAAGTFSNGTPDFNDPEVCDIIKRIYAPAYNSGLIDFDMHLYTPALDRFTPEKQGEWQWYERRFEFLFTKCGFDPRVRNIHASEWGLDILGSGGYKQNAGRIKDVPAMIRQHALVCSQDMIINGLRFPTPMIGGALFMAGENHDPRWRDGYDVRQFLPGIRELY